MCCRTEEWSLLFFGQKGAHAKVIPETRGAKVRYKNVRENVGNVFFRWSWNSDVAILYFFWSLYLSYCFIFAQVYIFPPFFFCSGDSLLPNSLSLALVLSKPQLNSAPSNGRSRIRAHGVDEWTNWTPCVGDTKDAFRPGVLQSALVNVRFLQCCS